MLSGCWNGWRESFVRGFEIIYSRRAFGRFFSRDAVKLSGCTAFCREVACSAMHCQVMDHFGCQPRQYLRKALLK
jgi:hypothetical protein